MTGRASAWRSSIPASRRGTTISSQDGLGSQRVDRFVDFVNGHTTPYDDYGHGTHVAGIIAGNGFDSNGARTGIAPRSRLVALKVLDRPVAAASAT